MSEQRSRSDETFEPGQWGLRHLLGLLTVAAVILGLVGAHLRTLSAAAALQVGLHWAVVLTIAAVSFGLHGRWRRRNLRAGGELWLRVLSRPASGSRRQFTRWLLTIAVIVDGALISTLTLPVYSRTLGQFAVGYYWLRF